MRVLGKVAAERFAAVLPIAEFSRYFAGRGLYPKLRKFMKKLLTVVLAILPSLPSPQFEPEIIGTYEKIYIICFILALRRFAVRGNSYGSGRRRRC